MNESIMKPVAMAQDYQPTWRDRLRGRLFPYRHCHPPEAPGHYLDCITIHTTVGLSWIDRFRVMLTGRLEVTTRTVTENTIGKNVTASESYVLPPLFLERRKP